MILQLGTYLVKTLNSKRHMHPNVHSSTVHSSHDRTWKQPKCPWTDEWIEDVRHIYNGTLLSHRKRMK